MALLLNPPCNYYQDFRKWDEISPIPLVEGKGEFIDGEWKYTYPRYHHTYGDKKFNSGYDFHEGRGGDPHHSYEGLLYVQSASPNYQKYPIEPTKVKGGSGKDIYAPFQDIYRREANETCGGSPIDQSPEAFIDTHFIIEELTEDDIILLPFRSKTMIYYEINTRILSRKTPKGRTDNLVQLAETLSLEKIKKSIGFIDTMDLDVISKPYAGDLGIKSSSSPKKLDKPKKYKIKNVDVIINFNPSVDTLEIDTESFGIDSSATFAVGKRKKIVKKLAKLDIDFLYDEKKGGLYFNENGADKGFGDGGIIAILKGAPDLNSDNLEFV